MRTATKGGIATWIAVVRWAVGIQLALIHDVRDLVAAGSVNRRGVATLVDESVLGMSRTGGAPPGTLGLLTKAGGLASCQ
ncbi:MAG: hypothetical protein CMJ78_23090 [Planctomycetaceae bacterium]|nr:hypothetical protein [Planctomycetaceae bacterium]